MQPAGVNPDPLQHPQVLGDLLLYRLSVITRHSSLPMVRLFEGELGITRRHWHVLALVVEHGVLRPSQVAELSWLDRPQASRALAGLLDRGLLRHESGGDRGRQVVATEQGAQLYARALARVAQFNAELVAGLTAAERAQLHQLLQHLQGRVQTLAAEVARQAPRARRSRGGTRRGTAGLVEGAAMAAVAVAASAVVPGSSCPAQPDPPARAACAPRSPRSTR